MEYLGKEYPEPDIALSYNGEKLDINKENTTLYKYRKLGETGIRLSMYDHIYYQDDEKAVYGFLSSLSEKEKDELAISMICNGYTVIQNIKSVSEFDENAYTKCVIDPQIESMINKDIPSEWFDEK